MYQSTNLTKIRAISFPIALVFLLSACQIQRAEVARQAQRSMVGLSREGVLACMGPPIERSQTGQVEVWSYFSGGEVDSFAFSGATGNSTGNATVTARPNNSGSDATIRSTTTTNVYGSSLASSQVRSCVVNVVFQGSAVQAVNYVGRTGGLLTQGEQCAFAVQNCTK